VGKGTIQHLVDSPRKLNSELPGHPAKQQRRVDAVLEVAHIGMPLLGAPGMAVVNILLVPRFLGGEREFRIKKGFIIEYFQEPMEVGRLVSDFGYDPGRDIFVTFGIEYCEDVHGFVDGLVQALLPSSIVIVVHFKWG